MDPTLTAAPDDPTRTFAYADAAVARSEVPTVPGFAIERELGRGGMGVVYLATQLRLNRPVALKMLIGGGHASVTDVARFAAEAEAGAAVVHPGIVQIYECGHCDGLPYFALEYCPGGSLANQLAGTPKPPREAAALLITLAHAVHAAHERAIIHRDLKPANVLLAADGSPKIADFGLARRSDSASGLTATGAVLGTPSYMAPEQASGAKGVTLAADVYALGAILYECLTGRPPFRAATAVETVMQVLKEEPVPPSRLAPGIPRDVETIALKCLQKEPTRRYSSAAALADDLERFLDGRSIVARPAGSAERLWKATKRHPAVAASIAFALLTIATVIGVVMWSNARLQTERDAARTAESTADAERAKALDRLQKALDVVDRMTNVASGVQWAGRPELQVERRKLLEEAIAFYERLAADDAENPLVRRESAQAYSRVGAAYLALGDREKAEAALRKAVAKWTGLREEVPDRADIAADASDARGSLGHVLVLSDRMPEAKSEYEACLALAQGANELQPGNPEVQLRLAESRLHLGYFNSVRDPAQAREHGAKALEIAEAIGRTPGAAYGQRMTLANALVLVGTLDRAANRTVEAGARLRDAAAILDELSRRTAPDARRHEEFVQARAMCAMQAGLLLAKPKATAAERKEALAEFQRSEAAFDSLLAIHPKAYVHRIQKHQLLVAWFSLLSSSERTEEARAVFRRLDSLETATLADNPALSWMRYVSSVPRSLALVYEARTGDLAAIGPAAAALLRLPGADPVVTYNVACAWAVAASRDKAHEAEHAAEAMKQLNGLVKRGYFDRAKLDHAKRDTDLDAIRTLPAFAEFLKAAEATVKRERPPIQSPPCIAN